VQFASGGVALKRLKLAGNLLKGFLSQDMSGASGLLVWNMSGNGM